MNCISRFGPTVRFENSVVNWRLFRGVWAVVAVSGVAGALAQPTQRADESEQDGLAHGRRLLEGVRDNVFSFDDPAFYWFCAYVKRLPGGELRAGPEEPAVPWKFLMERPGDYRGQAVVVEGFVQARWAWEVENRGDIGRLYQLELSEAGTRALCAVVLTEDPGEIPIRTRIRTKGYFIKVRAFQSADGQTGGGPLILARSVEVVRPVVHRVPGTSTGNTGAWLIGGTAGLAVIWLVLRARLRKEGRGGSGRGRLHGGGRSARDDGDFEWLLQDHGDDDRGGAGT
jgi:hypothetical protein